MTPSSSSSRYARFTVMTLTLGRHGKRANGRQLLRGPPLPHGNPVANLLHDLQIHRPGIGMADRKFTVHMSMHSIYAPLRGVSTRRARGDYATAQENRGRAPPSFSLQGQRHRVGPLRPLADEGVARQVGVILRIQRSHLQDDLT